MYAAFASVKLLDFCHTAYAGMGSSVDIFHLAILAQLAIQMRRLGSQRDGQASAANEFSEVSHRHMRNKVHTRHEY